MASRPHEIKKQIVGLLKFHDFAISEGAICRMSARLEPYASKTELASAMNSLYRGRIIRLRQRKPFAAFIMGQVEVIVELTAKGIRTKRYK